MTARRIVSLCPSTTETLFALGAGSRVVGRTKFCVEPRGRVEGVPVMGGTKDPRLERILDAAPDLVLMNEEENRREDAEALRAAGATVDSSLPRGPRDVPDLLRRLGSLAGEPARGDLAAALLEARLQRVERAAAQGPRVRFACLIWRRPWMAVGGNTYMSAMLEHAGGENVFAANRNRYPEVSAESIVEARPDVVILPDEPFPFGEDHVRELAEVSGLSSARITTTEGSLLSWHGSRTRPGLDAALRLLRAALRERPRASELD